MDPNLDFHNEGNKIKQVVFYVSVPVFFVNSIFLVVLISYTCSHLRKLYKTSTLTKFQFFLIYVIVIVELFQNFVNILVTRKTIMHVEDEQPHDPESMSKFAYMMFSNCAKGARLFFGFTNFCVALSTYLLGYRKISLALTI